MWLGILYAGADHPPPPGFIVVLIIDLLSSLVVYFRIGNYLKWLQEGKKYSFLFVILRFFYFLHSKIAFR
jgi:hypothetical protein